MKRVLALASAFLFAAGMAVAQDNNTQSSAKEPTVDSNNLRGCLTAGGDQFKLTTDIGAKVINLNVDKKSATPYVAHEVELQGMSTQDGTFRVDRILDIADHCGHSGQATADTSSAKDITDVNRQAAVQSNDLPNGNATHTENPVKGPYDKTAASSSAGSAQMTDQTAASQTPATSPDMSASASTPAQQSNATSATAPATDTSAQNNAAAQPSTTTSTTDTTSQSSSVASNPTPAPTTSGVATEQSANSAQNNAAAAAPATSSADQSAASTQSTTTTSDQSATAAQSSADQKADQNASAGKQLPQTGSPLPLLGLLGMGSLAAGFVSRKRKK